MSNNHARIVVTGLAWLGGGFGSIDTAIEEILRSAESEILVAAYAVGSGADLILCRIEVALERGIQTKMIVNRLETQPEAVTEELLRLARFHPHFCLYSFTSDANADLHAKLIVVDRRTALVGSSNLSRRGLLTNHELAVVIGGDAASTAARAFDRLLTSRYIKPFVSPDS